MCGFIDAGALPPSIGSPVLRTSTSHPERLSTSTQYSVLVFISLSDGREHERRHRHAEAGDPIVLGLHGYQDNLSDCT